MLPIARDVTNKYIVPNKDLTHNAVHKDIKTTSCTKHQFR
jgi:hypothetical protein